MELPQVKSTKEVNKFSFQTKASFPMEKQLSEANKFKNDVSVNLEAEIPEELYKGMKDFIGTNPQWDQYRLMQAAIAGFLVQNGVETRPITRLYVGNMFNNGKLLSFL